MEGPRLQGIQEHLARAEFLLDISHSVPDAIARYRLQLSAIYSCRAVVELMLEAAEKQQVASQSTPALRWDRKELEDYVSPKLAFYSLIERIRIHDFHRFGLLPPDPAKQQAFLGGPVKLMVQRGGAALAIGENGPIQSTSGDSQKKAQRPLLTRDDEFYDEDSSSYVSLEAIIEQFIRSANPVVTELATSVA